MTPGDLFPDLMGAMIRCSVKTVRPGEKRHADNKLRALAFHPRPRSLTGDLGVGLSLSPGLTASVVQLCIQSHPGSWVVTLMGRGFFREFHGGFPGQDLNSDTISLSLSFSSRLTQRRCEITT